MVDIPIENMDVEALEPVVGEIIEEWLLNGVFEGNGDFSASESSNEDECEHEPRVCMKNYIENTVHLYSGKAFVSHFRLTHESVYYLIERFQQTDFLVNIEPFEQAITHERAFLITLWYLANTETLRQVADRFDLSRSCAHRILLIGIDFINSLTEEVQRRRISEGFARKRHIHGIIGAIDGCHIRIRKPVEHQEDYFNRKKFHSISLQAVVTNEKIFTDVYIGEPGSMHDARILRRSPLYEEAMEEPDFFGEYYLLGDSAYPSLQWLVPPFRDNGRLTRQERRFNFRHASTRVKVEQAFGLLNSKFRRLSKFNNLRIDIIVRCILASCILHNIYLRRDRGLGFDADDDDENSDYENDNNESSGSASENDEVDEDEYSDV